MMILRIAHVAILTFVLCCADAALTQSQDLSAKFERIPSRDDVRVRVYWARTTDAKGTVLFFPGGNGTLGVTSGGTIPAPGNSIVGTAEYLLANRYDVVMFGLPTDATANGHGTTGAGRVQPSHLDDIRAVVGAIKRRTENKPIWVMGFSAGTVSATFAAIYLNDPVIAGLVLTGGLYKHMGSLGYVRHIVTSQEIARISVPVLIYHHAKDACGYCDPAEAQKALPKFTDAPIKKFILRDGGSNPTGDPCHNKHWHGFPGMEKQAIDEMAAWMDDPKP